MALTLTNDYLVWDNREDVTAIHVATAGETEYDLTAPDDQGAAKRRPLTFKELAASNGVYTAQDRMWLVPVAVLPLALDEWKPRDRLRDAANVEWTVLSADLNTWETWWKLTTRNLVLAEDLRSLATIQRPDNLQDTAAGRWPLFANVYVNIPCRVQPMTAVRTEAFGKIGLERAYDCFLGQQVNVTSEDRVVVGGVNYQIRSFRNPERIDELQVLELEKLP